MRIRVLFLTVAPLLASAAFGQLLDCPSSASRTTEPFHFHVQMYRPDTRGFLDVWGINDFASPAACDRAREAAIKRNLAVVNYFKQVRGENQYEPDRFGTCHADMSIDKTNPRYLNDAQRVLQVRAAEDVRQRVRERLMNAGLTTDSEVFRSVGAPVSAPSSLISGPKLVQLPQTGVVQTTYSASDLKPTRAIDTAKPAVASLDLPLVDPTAGGAIVAPTPVAIAAPAPQPAQPAVAAPAPKPASPDAAAAASPAVATEPEVAPTTTPSPAASPALESAEDVADSFVAYETQRIQTVLKASSVISDEGVKSKIYDACMQRSQLLSNLRSLIEVSGAKSRLAANAKAARTEDERLQFVSKLFGDDMRMHWAPKDATDVILEPQADVDQDVVNVLRDATNKYSGQQKRRALYILLARGQPTEEQQLWLTTIAESFFQ